MLSGVRNRQSFLLMWLILSATSLALCPANAESSSHSVTVIISDREVDCDVQPLRDGEEILLPGSLLSREIGMQVIENATIPGMWDVRFYGDRLSVRPDKSSALLNGQTIHLQTGPKVVDGTLFLPASVLFDCFGIAYDTSSTGDDVRLHIKPPGARIASIRHHVHPDKFRVVVDLDGLAAFSWIQEDDSLSLRIQAPEDGPAPLLQSETLSDPIVRSIETEPDDGLGITIITTAGQPKCHVFTLGGPPRIVVDFLRPLPQPPPISQLNRAMRFERRVFATSRGPALSNVMVVDLNVPGVSIRPALAGETVAQRAQTSRIGAREGALVSINGGFFAPRGQPLGLLVIDGEWITHPIKGRTCLGITNDGKLLMGRVIFDGRVTADGAGTVALDGLNCGHVNPNEAIAYTTRWGPKLAGHPTAVRVVISQTGVITLVEKWQRDVVIPPGGFVISSVGAKAKQLEKAQRGGSAKVELRTKPNWPNLRHAIGGGPRLVKNGQVFITADIEGFASDVWAGRAPRTAVGIRPNGQMLLVTVDGRQPGISEGVTLRELANLMIKLGARDAMALDGGGSTTFWLKGQIMNRPSDGVERRVSNALVVIAEAPEG